MLIIVADNINIVNHTIRKAIEEMDHETIKTIVRKIENAGADAIDINPGPLTQDLEKIMTFLVETVQDVSDLPILIDTANPEAMECGLRVNRKTAIINGFSLETDKLEFILPLAEKYESDIIGYLLYPNSHVPENDQERLNIAIELYNEFQKAGIDNERLIIDPVVVPVFWQNGKKQASDILNVIRMLPEIFGFPVKTVAGISNLTTGDGDTEKKLLLEQTYLPMLAASGLSMAMLNVYHEGAVRVIKTINALTNEKIFSWEEI